MVHKMYTTVIHLNYLYTIHTLSRWYDMHFFLNLVFHIDILEL